MAVSRILDRKLFAEYVVVGHTRLIHGLQGTQGSGNFQHHRQAYLRDDAAYGNQNTTSSKQIDDGVQMTVTGVGH
jgi:hypothetical protein